MNRKTLSVAIAGLALALAIGSSSGRSAEPIVGHVYTLDNNGASNSVVILNRLADGTLAEMTASPVPTGGKGLVVPQGGDLDRRGPFAFTAGIFLQQTPAAIRLRSLTLLLPVDSSRSPVRRFGPAVLIQ